MIGRCPCQVREIHSAFPVARLAGQIAIIGCHLKLSTANENYWWSEALIYIDWRPFSARSYSAYTVSGNIYHWASLDPKGSGTLHLDCAGPSFLHFLQGLKTSYLISA